MIRALLVAVSSAAAALALASPAAAEPTPAPPPLAPCGSHMCTYHQLSDEDEWADEDEAEEEDWAGPSMDNPLGIEPNLEMCGGFDTAIPFVGVYSCVPLLEG